MDCYGNKGTSYCVLLLSYIIEAFMTFEMLQIRGLGLGIILTEQF
jgi:hypothetical protein